MITWLASYPKSGNTCLRALITAYFFLKEKDFNLQKRIEESLEKEMVELGYL